MIEDTIRAVKEAEAMAETVAADAAKQADSIAQDSKAQAAKLIEDANEAAKKTVAAALEKAKAAGEERLKAGDVESAQAAGALRQFAQPKKDGAVSAVVEALLE